MFDFCPHCGNTLGGQDQVEGRAVLCRYCGQTLGVVRAEQKIVVDRGAELLQGGTAAKCPACGRFVEVKASGGVGSLVPHFAPGVRKMCPGAGKPVTGAVPAPPPQPPAPAGKDMAALRHREVGRAVACPRDGAPTVEVLTLEYLDKRDRVRVQIEALRDILGPDFRMKEYPPVFGRPHLAVWGNSSQCVVAGRHDQGGYRALTDTEVGEVLADLAGDQAAFFG